MDHLFKSNSALYRHAQPIANRGQLLQIMKIVQKKVCLLGDFGVGKTSLIRRFVDGIFDDRYLSTIGVKISRKTLVRDASKLNLLIWDLAGGDDYTKARTSYIKGAAGALIVCDLTRPETLAALEKYTIQLQDVAPNAGILYAGNKVDLVDDRSISDEELAAESERLGGTCFFTSAKTGEAVEGIFSQLALTIEGE